MEEKIEFRPIYKSDRAWVEDLLTREWGSSIIVTRGKKYDALFLPGIIGYHNNSKVGLLTYNFDGDTYEIVTLNSIVHGIGVGKGLIAELKKIAKESGAKRVWLITTNDNTNAIEFYKKQGFTVNAVYKNAVEESRKIKPEIPLIGENDIPIKDEIEMELLI